MAIVENNNDYTVDFKKVNTSAPLEYFVFSITPKNATAKANLVKKAFAYDYEKTTPKATPFYAPALEKPSNFYERKKPLLVINATGWKQDMSPQGLMIKEGVTYQEMNYGRDPWLAVFDNAGTMKLVDVTGKTGAQIIASEGAKNTFYFGRWLVKNNVKAVYSSSDDEMYNELHPRQAIGQKADGTLVIVTVDGRSSTSIGINLYNLATIMQNEGCPTAYNLDGGGSAQTIFKGTPVNNCSDVGGRAVIDMLYIDYPIGETGGKMMEDTLQMYNWKETDEVQNTINGVSDNFKLISKELSQRVYNVMSPLFGAKGNYILNANGLPPLNNATNTALNDSVAIQKAFDACKVDGGGVVHFPAGNYAIKTPIKVYKNTKVVFHPQTVIVRNAAIGYMFTNGDTGASYLGYSGNGNIHIEGNGGRLEGNSVNFVKKFNHISFAHADNISFDRVVFTNCVHYHHMEINSSKNVVVRSCTFDGFMFDPAESDASTRRSEALQFDGAYGADVFGNFGAYDDTTCKDVVVESCTFKNVNRGVGSHTSKTGKHHDTFRIVNNYFLNIADFGIVTCMWDGTVIQGNTMDNIGGGVWIRVKDSTALTTGYTVSNNTFRNINIGTTTRHAIRVTGSEVGNANQISNMTIQGNSVDDCAQTAFYIEGVNRLTVTGNSITNVNAGGIYLIRVSEATVTGNVCSFINTNSGISCEGGSWINITGNLLNKIGQHGITIDGTTNAAVNCNSVREVSMGTAGGYCHIYIAGGALLAMVSGNTIKSGTPKYGIWVTSSQSGVVVVNNFASPLTVYQTNANNTITPNY